MSKNKIKEALLYKCQEYVTQRSQRIQGIINDIQESLSSETKSTAGDKHETGRAMLQLEREKAGAQLAQVQKLQQIVAKIDITASTHVRLGSLVETSSGNFFISISVGEVRINTKTYFVIAINSPIGKLLLGKKATESFEFNHKIFDIKVVA